MISLYPFRDISPSGGELWLPLELLKRGAESAERIVVLAKPSMNCHSLRRFWREESAVSRLQQKADSSHCSE
jgi:hypothetical protein